MRPIKQMQCGERRQFDVLQTRQNVRIVGAQGSETIAVTHQVLQLREFNAREVKGVVLQIRNKRQDKGAQLVHHRLLANHIDGQFHSLQMEAFVSAVLGELRLSGNVTMDQCYCACVPKGR